MKLSSDVSAPLKLMLFARDKPGRPVGEEDSDEPAEAERDIEGESRER